MKKTIICAILAGLLATTTVYANSIRTDVNSETRDITVTGNFDEAKFNKIVTLELKKEDDSSTQYHVAGIFTDANGAFNYTFRMPESSETGSYVLTLGVLGAEVTEQQVYFAKKTDIDALLAAINNATNASSIRSAIEVNINVLNISGVWYNKLDNDGKNAIADELYETRPYTSINLAKTNANTEMAINTFRCASTPNEIQEAMTEFSNIYNITTSTAACYELYQGMAYQSDARQLMSYTEPKTLEEVMNAYNESTLLTAINKAKQPADIGTYIDTYESVIPFSMSTYKEANRDKMLSYLYKYDNYQNMDDLNDMIEKGYDDQVSIDPPSGGSGGGGGSSKGDSGLINYPTSTPAVVDTDNQNGQGTELEFNDLSAAQWAKEAISYLAEKKIVSGTGENRFEPNQVVTREQFVKMLVAAFGLEKADATCSFSDMKTEHWAYKAVASAYASGIVSGISATEFGTGVEISRQDMAVMTYKAAKAAGYDLGGGYEINFSDRDQIADYAQESVGAMYGKKIINGYPDGRFAPNETATRAQASQVIYSLIKQ